MFLRLKIRVVSCGDWEESIARKKKGKGKEIQMWETSTPMPSKPGFSEGGRKKGRGKKPKKRGKQGLRISTYILAGQTGKKKNNLHKGEKKRKAPFRHPSTSSVWKFYVIRMLSGLGGGKKSHPKRKKEKKKKTAEGEWNVLRPVTKTSRKGGPKGKKRKGKERGLILLL